MPSFLTQHRSLRFCALWGWQRGSSHLVAKDPAGGSCITTYFLGLGGNDLTHPLCDGASSSGLQGYTTLHRGQARENLPENWKVEG